MLTIMVIEDDKNLASLLTRFLNMEGFVVKAPADHDINTTLNNMRADCPQIALIDVNLKSGSGLDIVRAIRHEAKIKDTCILMASGSSMKKECLQAGADGFIMKPFMPDELIDIIRKTYQKYSN